MNITSLGEARFPSPDPHTVNDQARICAVIVRDPAAPKRDEVLFELAGRRTKLFFDPAKTRAGIITCGGLCPGLNSVMRALFLELHHTYGAAEVLGQFITVTDTKCINITAWPISHVARKLLAIIYASVPAANLMIRQKYGPRQLDFL